MKGYLAAGLVLAALLIYHLFVTNQMQNKINKQEQLVVQYEQANLEFKVAVEQNEELLRKQQLACKAQQQEQQGVIGRLQKVINEKPRVIIETKEVECEIITVEPSFTDGILSFDRL